MSRIAYVNGRYLPQLRRPFISRIAATSSPTASTRSARCRGGRLVDERRHMATAQRSLDELRIAMPMSPTALGVVLREMLAPQPRARRHRLSADHPRRRAPRSCLSAARHAPRASWSPPAASTSRATRRTAAEGIAVITVPDNRWERVDIKSVSLLPNVLAKQAAREQGAKEAWFVDRDGHVTEGLVEQCLDRHQRREGGHPAGRSRHPAGHHPDRLARRHQGPGAEARGTRRSRSRRPMPRARPSSPRPARS